MENKLSRASKSPEVTAVIARANTALSKAIVELHLNNADYKSLGSLTVQTLADALPELLLALGVDYNHRLLMCVCEGIAARLDGSDGEEALFDMLIEYLDERTFVEVLSNISKRVFPPECFATDVGVKHFDRLTSGNRRWLAMNGYVSIVQAVVSLLERGKRRDIKSVLNDEAFPDKELPRLFGLAMSLGRRKVAADIQQLIERVPPARA